jgi:hypothetical protein
VEGSCEHSNEPSGSIKCWEIQDQQNHRSINKIQTSWEKRRTGMTKEKTEKSIEDKTVTLPKIQIRRKLVTEQTTLNIQFFKHYL